eukprot:COSAG04_NODE_18860_length_431_cov_0.512048_2_plen_98_part_01
MQALEPREAGADRQGTKASATVRLGDLASSSSSASRWDGEPLGDGGGGSDAGSDGEVEEAHQQRFYGEGEGPSDDESNASSDELLLAGDGFPLLAAAT